MQNYFNLETEAAHRQREWERKRVAAEQQSQARLKNGPDRWSHLPLLARAYLRSLAAPRVRPSRHGDAPSRGAPPSPWQEIVPLGPDRAAVA